MTSLPPAKRPRTAADSGHGTVSHESLTIEPFQPPPLLSGPHMEKRWQDFVEGLRSMFWCPSKSDNPFSYSWEIIYQNVEDLCLCGLDAKLAAEVDKQCQEATEMRFTELVKTARDIFAADTSSDNAGSATEEPEAFLRTLQTHWEQHQQDLQRVSGTCAYLDTTSVHSQDRHSIWTSGIQRWRRCLLSEMFSFVSTRAVASLLALVSKERDGSQVSHSLLVSIVDMYWQTDLYDRFFEEEFLVHTGRYYRMEAHRLLVEELMPVDAYLRHVHSRLRSEQERAHNYLKPQTTVTLLQRVEVELVQKHIQRLLTLDTQRDAKSGLAALLSQSQVEELAMLYQILKRLGALDALLEAFANYTRQAGRAIILSSKVAPTGSSSDAKEDIESRATRQKRASDLVLQLLDLKRRLSSILAYAFEGNEEYQFRMKRSFEDFLNEEPLPPVELIAIFVDQKLRERPRKGSTNEHLIKLLSEVVFLFRYLQAKDVFQAKYRRDLASRLLLGTCTSRDAEVYMIQQFHQEVGSGFSRQLESMMKDVEISEDIHREFIQHRSKQVESMLDNTVETNFQVLESGKWPEFVPASPKLPTVLRNFEGDFSQFYIQKFKGRKLTFQYSLCSATVRAHFPKGRRDLSVSAFQTCILLCFNDRPRLSLTQLLRFTGLTRDLLVRTLVSLSIPSHRLILKEPNSEVIADDDIFHVNLDFESPSLLVRCNEQQGVLTVKEKFQELETIQADRHFAIEASIVRVMKVHKTLEHSRLIAELTKALPFPVEPADVKRRIGQLIEREYLERDPKNSSIYIYKP